MNPSLAVGVIAEHYNASQADQVALLKLLEALGLSNVSLFLENENVCTLGEYLVLSSNDHQRVVDFDIVDSQQFATIGDSLFQVAIMVVLAGARAIADVVARAGFPDLRKASDKLEWLLDAADDHGMIREAVTLKSHRTAKMPLSLARIQSVSAASSVDHAENSPGRIHRFFPILSTINSRLRVCDIATQVLAATVRSVLHDREACDDAMRLSSTLLTLGGALPPDGSGESLLQPALVAGASCIGSIMVNHPNVDPLAWLQAANNLFLPADAVSTPGTPHPLLMAALLGGMVKVASHYIDGKCDENPPNRIAILLSTLLTILEITHVTKEPLSIPEAVDGDISGATHIEKAAAMEFMGERVIPVEEDIDYNFLNHVTVSAVCDEFVRRSGAYTSIFELVTRLLSAAGSQFVTESLAEARLLNSCSGSASNEQEQHQDDASSLSCTPACSVLDDFDSATAPASPVLSFAAEPVISMRERREKCMSRIDCHLEIGALCFEALTRLIELWMIPRPCSRSEYVSGDPFSELLEIALESVGKFSRDVHEGIIREAVISLRGVQDRCAEVSLSSQVFGSSRLTNGKVRLFCEMRRFSESVGGWVGSGLDSALLHRLACVAASSGCPLDVVQIIFQGVSQTLFCRTLTEAFLCRLFQSSDRFEFCNSYDMDGRCWPLFKSASFLTSLVSAENAAQFLTTIFAQMREWLQGRRPPTVLHARCFTVLFATIGYLLRYCIDGSGKATRYLRGVMRSVRKVSHDNCSQYENISYTVGVELLSLSSDDASRLADVCTQVVCLFGAVIETLVNTSWQVCSEGHAWHGKEEKISADSMSCLCTEVDKAGALASELYFCLQIACDVAQFARRILSTTGEPTRHLRGVTDAEGSQCAGSSAVFCGCSERSILRAVHELVSSTSAPECHVIESSRISQLSKQWRDINDRNDSLKLADFLHLDWDMLCLNCMLCSGSSCRQDFRSDIMLELFVEVQRCIDLFPDVLSGDSVAAIRKFSTGGIEEAPVCGMLKSVASFAGLAAVGDHALSVGKCLEDLGLILISISDQECRWDTKSFAIASEISSRIGQSSCCLRIGMRKWMSAAVGVVLPLLNFSERQYFCDVANHGVTFHRTLSRATESKAHFEEFLKLLLLDGDDSERTGLHFALGDCASFPGVLDSGAARLLSDVVPTQSLCHVLEALMISRDTSAVCVEHTAKSLGLLTQACSENQLWLRAVCAGLHKIAEDGPFCSDGDDFFRRLLMRSVFDSVTMSKSLNNFLRPLAQASAGHCASLILDWLLKAEHAVSHLLRNAVCDIPVDSLERGVVFATSVCLAIDFLNMKCEEQGIFSSSRRSSAVARLVSALSVLLDCLWSTGEEDSPLLREEAARKSVFLVRVIDVMVRKFSIGSEIQHSEAGLILTRILSDTSDLDCDVLNLSSLSSDVETFDLDQSTCTYTSTGSQFVEQHWYFCYTCGLTGSEGVCAVCARVCHAGHDVSYSRLSRFFCDCGASSAKVNVPPASATTGSVTSEVDAVGGRDTRRSVMSFDPLRSRSSDTSGMKHSKHRACHCLNPRDKPDRRSVKERKTKHTNASSENKMECKDVFAAVMALIGEELDDMMTEKEVVTLSASIKSAMKELVSSDKFSGSLLRVARGLLGGQWFPESFLSVTSRASRNGTSRESKSGKGSVCLQATRIGQLNPNNTNLRSRNLGDIPKPRRLFSGQRVTFSDHGNFLAAIEEGGKIVIASYSLNQFSRTPSNECHFRCLSVIETHFVPLAIEFHPDFSHHLMLYSMSHVSVYQITDEGRICSRIDVAVGLDLEDMSAERSDVSDPPQGSNFIRRCKWICGGSLIVLVITSDFIKIFNMNEDVVSPAHYLSSASLKDLAPGSFAGDVGIVDACLHVTPDCNIVQTSLGQLYTVLSDGSLFEVHLLASHKGPVETQQIQLLSNRVATHQRRNPVALVFLPLLRSLCILYNDGYAELIPSCSEQSVRTHRSESKLLCVVDQDSASPPGTCALYPVSISRSQLLCFSPGKGIDSCHFVDFTQDDKSHVHSLDSSVHGNIIGICSVIPAVRFGYPLSPALLTVVEDGSVYLLREHSEQEGICLPGEEGGFSLSNSDEKIDIVTENEHNALTQGFKTGDYQRLYSLDSLMPTNVGFYENCRPISDEVSVGFPDSSGKFPQGDKVEFSVLSGCSRGSFTCSSTRRKFCILLRCSNKAITMVGVRVQVGATDKTRSQGPGRISVFGRSAYTLRGEVSAKRWIDIPFAVFEYLGSPREVRLELEPKRQADGSFSGDGSVSIDDLEAYGIKANELNERKNAFEAEIERNDMMMSRKIEQYRRARLYIRPLRLPKQAMLHNGDVLYERFGGAFTAAVICLQLILACSSPISSQSAAALSVDLMSHDMHVIAWAKRRLCDVRDSVCLQDSLLTTLVHQCLLSSHGSSPFSAEVYAASICDRATRTLAVLDSTVMQCVLRGEYLHPLRIERALFLAANAFQFGFWAVPNLPSCVSDEMKKLQSSFRRTGKLFLGAECLEVLSSSFLRLSRSEKRSLLSLRGACSNVVDLLMNAMYFSDSCLSSADTCSRSMDVDDELCVSCADWLCDALFAEDEDVRLYVSARIMDVFEFSASITRECMIDEDSWRVCPEEATDSNTSQPSTQQAQDAECDGNWMYKCDSCAATCEDEWWHCADCDDLDVCQNCVGSQSCSFPEAHQPDHLMLGVSKECILLLPGSQWPNEADAVYHRIFRVFVRRYFLRLRELLERDGTPRLQLDESVQLLQRLLLPRRPTAARCRLGILFEQDTGFMDLVLSLLSRASSGVADKRAPFGPSLSMMGGLSFSKECARTHVQLLVLNLLQCLDDAILGLYMVRNGAVSSLLGVLSDLLEIVQRDIILLAGGSAVGGLHALDSHARPDFFDEQGLAESPVRTVRLPFLGTNCEPRCVQRTSPYGGQNEQLVSPIAVAGKIFDVVRRALKAVSDVHVEEELRAVSRRCVCTYANILELHDPCHKLSDSADESELREIACAALFLQKNAREVFFMTCKCDGLQFGYELDLVVLRQRFKAVEQILVCRSRQMSEQLSQWHYDLSKAISLLHAFATEHSDSWRMFTRGFGSQKLNELENAYDALDRLHLSLSFVKGDTRVKILEVLALAVDSHSDGMINKDTAAQEDEVLECSILKDASGTCQFVAQSFTAAEPNQRHPSQVEDLVLLFFIASFGSRLSVIISDLNTKDHPRSVRNAAGVLLQSLLHKVRCVHDIAALNVIGDTLQQSVGALSLTGTCGGEMVEAMCAAVEAARELADDVMSFSWVQDLCSSLTYLVRRSSERLSTHPNAHIYKALSTFMVLDGYYLESEPCLSCCSLSDEESSKSVVAVDALKAESKYTHKAILCRLNSPQSVTGVLLRVSDSNPLRQPKAITVYRSVRTVVDAAELKSKEHSWVKLGDLLLGLNEAEGTLYLDVPVIVSNIMFEFTEFHGRPSRDISSTVANVVTTPQDVRSSVSVLSVRASDALDWTPNSGDRLLCPRCSRQVTDRYGICRSCGENSFQCRACRNIMYEVLDGFLCNECGFCKHGKFDFSLLCSPSYAAESVQSESDRKRAALVIEREASIIHSKFEQLKSLRADLVRVLSHDTRVGASREDAEDKPFREMTINPEPVSRTGGLTDMGGMDMILRTLMRDDESLRISRSLLSRSRSTSAPADGLPMGHLDVPEQLSSPQLETISEANNDTGVEQSSSAEPEARFQIAKTASDAATVYDRDCKAVFLEMVRSIKVLTSTRHELCRYALSSVRGCPSTGTDHGEEAPDGDMSSSDARRETHGSAFSGCYGCAQVSLSSCLPLLEKTLRQNSKFGRSFVQPDFGLLLLRCANLFDSQQAQDSARRIIVLLVKDNVETTELICSEIRRKVEFCIEYFQSVSSISVASMELAVLQDILRVDDACWEERLRTVLRLLFYATRASLESSAVAENIVVPCIRSAAIILAELPRSVRAAKSVDSYDSSSRQSAEDGTDAALDEAMPRNASSVVAHETDDSCIVTYSDAGSDLFQAGGNAGTVDESENLSCSPPPSELAPASAEPLSEVETSVKSDRDDCNSCLRHRMHELELQHDCHESFLVFDEWVNKHVSFSSWKKTSHAPSLEANSSVNAANNGESMDESTMLLMKYMNKWRKSARFIGGNSETSRPAVLSDCIADMIHDEKSWAFRLILFSPSAMVRGETCRLLEAMCAGEEILELRLLDSLLASPLEHARRVGIMSSEYFELITRLTARSCRRLYLISGDFILRLAQHIEREAYKLESIEEALLRRSSELNLFHGYVLKRLTDLLLSLLEVLSDKPISVRHNAVTKNGAKLVPALLRTYLVVCRLVLLRSKLLDECLSALCTMLASPQILFLPPAGEIVVSACVVALEGAHESRNMPVVAAVLDLLCKMLCPVKEDPVYHLVLQKAPTQEEYIRGSMTRLTYPTTEFEGPLMRDVKRKICQDLDLTSLLEDDLGDFGLELLVAGNVIKLDLPIRAVYENVWRNSAEATSSMSVAASRRSLIFRRTSVVSGEPVSRVPSRANCATAMSETPMVVVYRLSGLDGEATEPIIDSLPADYLGSIDPEEEFKKLNVLGEVSGLQALVKLLSGVDSWGNDSDVAVREPALRLLRASCETAANRACIAALPCSISTLIDCAASALDRCHESAAAIESAESLSIAIEKILSERALSSKSLVNESNENNESSENNGSPEIERRANSIMARLHVFLDHLKVVSSPKAESALLRLLPYLIQGSPRALDVAMSHLEINWASVDSNAMHQRAGRQLAVVLSAAPLNIYGLSICQLLLERGFAGDVLRYLTGCFPYPKAENAEAWTDSLEKQGPLIAINVLKGLALSLSCDCGEVRVDDLLRFHFLDRVVLGTLCQIEMSVSCTSIGSAAEELIDALRGDEKLGQEVVMERNRIHLARRTAAEASRSAIVALSKTQPIWSPQGADSSVDLMSEVQDEIGPSCVVCGDGFTNRPDDALSVYVLSRRVNLDDVSSAREERSSDCVNLSQNAARALYASLSKLWESLTEGDCVTQTAGRSRQLLSAFYGFTNVTHFYLIHLGCHREAARSDRSLRPPREEWDGAALRNSQTKCNNLYPVKPPACVLSGSEQISASALTPTGSRLADVTYEAAVDYYFARLSSLGRTGLNRLVLVVFDLAQSLKRFAQGSPSLFSEHSCGGGAHSNVCIIPHMLQLAWHVMDKSVCDVNCVDAIHDMLSSSSAFDNIISEDISAFLAISLVALGPHEWSHVLARLLRKCSRSTDPAGEDGMSNKRVVYRMIAFTDALNRKLKLSTDSSSGHWREATMRSIARDERWLLGQCTEIADMWDLTIRHITDERSFRDYLNEVAPEEITSEDQ